MKSMTEIKRDVFEIQCAVLDENSMPMFLQEDTLEALREAWYYLSQAEIYLQDSNIFKEV